MANPIEREFSFTDGTTHDATLSETSDELTSCYNYTWSISPLISGITGTSPIYTVEVSNDGINWYEYNSGSTNVDVIDAVDDNHLAFTKMRIVHIGTGTSGGTVTYKFVQKNG